MKKFKKIITVPQRHWKYGSQTEHYKQKYLEFKTTFAPGHFYSPYPDLKEVKERAKSLFNRDKKNIPGIDIREKQQVDFLKKLSKHYSKIPYTAKPDKKNRYYFENTAYSYTDATVLFCMISQVRPKRIIEIGSGFSSALMLDMNEQFFNNSMDLTFIEPYPELLLSLMKKGDKNRSTIIGKNLSKVDNKVFDKLKAGDVLFVDSTHVSKIGSDVNQILFEILPRLNKGVIVHIHDVFYPFEYPEEWINEMRAWNEDYMLRAFLYNNNEFEIMFFNHFMNVHHNKAMDKLLPLAKNNFGGSIWLKKV